MLGWRHSAFSAHNRTRSEAGDAEGRQRLARYMRRCPFAFAFETMRYDPGSGMVVYRFRLCAIDGYSVLKPGFHSTARYRRCSMR